MTVTNILFTPWMKEQSAAVREYIDKNQKWGSFVKAKGKRFFDVWYAGSHNQFLRFFTGPDVQIYIRGHGLPGRPTISTGSMELRYDEVAERLIKTGLQKEFSGKIKCYHCHSAELNFSRGNYLPPYAELFADYLFSKGYQSCTYYGYEGALDSYPGIIRPEKTTKIGEQLYTASDLRHLIRPQGQVTKRVKLVEGVGIVEF